MRKTLLIIFALILPLLSYSQKIKGKVIDEFGSSVVGATVH